MQDRNPVSTMWTQDEMNAMVEEARRAKCPIAAHCILPETAIMAANAGVTSIEHQWMNTDDSLEAMKKNDTIFIPTLSILELEKETAESYDEIFRGALEHTYKAWKMGIRLATGGDTGGWPHGENVREIELFVKAGIPLEEALWSATVGGFEACGGDWCGRRFGRVKEGWAGDFIAVEGDPRTDLGALRRVRHVVKDGRVVVRDGRVVEPMDV
jgi:imidazolonepropionase-like amidohydrolase